MNNTKSKIKAKRSSPAKLAGRLRLRFKAEGLVSGEPIPSIRQLCQEENAALLTCHKALKLLEAQGELRIFKNKGAFIAAPSSANESGRVAIAVLMPPVGSETELSVAFEQFSSGAMEYLRERGKSISILRREDLWDARVYEKELAESDALIATFGCIDERSIPLLRRWGRPVVVVQHEEILYLPFHQVVPDLEQGFLLAVDELDPANLDEIIVVSGGWTHEFRIRIFLEALKIRGVSTPVRRITSTRQENDLGRSAGRVIGEEIVRTRSSRTGIFSPSDFISFGVVDALRTHGIKFGARMRLVSFDDLEGAGVIPFGVPLITSVANPRRRISVEAARLLCGLERGDDGISQVLRIHTTISRRASTRG
ncbi:MAG: substrate-binding domain-containing protein [Victivallales bacterium]